jgi:hypothetical protein
MDDPESSGHRGCLLTSCRPILSAPLADWQAHRAGLDALEARLRITHPRLDWLDGMRTFKRGPMT